MKIEYYLKFANDKIKNSNKFGFFTYNLKISIKILHKINKNTSAKLTKIF